MKLLFARLTCVSFCASPQVLAQQGLRSLPPDFDPDGLELTRYLLYGGMLAVSRGRGGIKQELVWLMIMGAMHVQLWLCVHSLQYLIYRGMLAVSHVKGSVTVAVGPMYLCRMLIRGWTTNAPS